MLPTEISMGDVEYWRKSQANGQLWMQIELNYSRYFGINHKNYDFLDCNWLEKFLFFTNSLAKLLSDSLLSDSSKRNHI